MTKKAPDTEFRKAFTSLLQRHYSGRLKDLAPDLGVTESTVSRWNNRKCMPNPEDRKKVIDLLDDHKNKDKDRWLRRLHYVFSSAEPDILRAILDIINGTPIGQIPPSVIDRMTQLFIVATETIT